MGPSIPNFNDLPVVKAINRAYEQPEATTERSGGSGVRQQGPRPCAGTAPES